MAPRLVQHSIEASKIATGYYFLHTTREAVVFSDIALYLRFDCSEFILSKERN